MKKIRIFWKKLWHLKNVIVIISTLFIFASIVCLTIFLANCDGTDCFKDVALIVASIAVGLIPIAIQINERDEKNKRQSFIEHSNAVSDIEKLRLLDVDANHLFIRRTLENFYSKYGVNKLCESFLNFKNNLAFYNSINQIFSKSTVSVWQNLVESIESCLYFLPNASQLKNSDLTPNDKLDLFLAAMVNEMEIIDLMCYRYLTMKIDRDMFDNFEKKPIMRMYSYCYYLLVELRINNRFKHIDSVCGIMKTEEEDIKDEPREQ